jgi:carboxyl-terminal processing protease
MRSNRARVLFVVASLATLFSIRALARPQGGQDPASKALSIFSDVFSLTRSNYVESVDSRTLLEGAYDGMSDALDPFSYYVPAASLSSYKAQISSGAVGPGIVLARRGGFPYVVAPLPGSPAERGGVRAGDLLDTVDGKSVRNAPLWKVKAALEGPEKTTVEIGIFRGADEKRQTLRLERARTEPTPVASRWERDVIILRVPSFSPATAGQLRRELEEANRRSIDRLIVDLRGSIGGEIADAAPAASLFLEKGPVGRLVSRRAPARPLETTGERIWKGRVVVLIDDSTGGPAEIFAGALQDRGGATTVGEQTVGMGIVQKLVPTGSGGSLYITVGRYTSPSGKVLGGKGLSPDHSVVVFPGDADDKRDPILERGLEVIRQAEPVRRAA